MNREARRKLDVRRISVRQNIQTDTHRSTGADFGLPGSGVYDPNISTGDRSTYNPSAVVEPSTEPPIVQDTPEKLPQPGQASWAGVAFWFVQRFPIGVILWFIGVIFFSRFFLQSLAIYREKRGYPADAGKYMDVITTALLPESILLGATLVLGIPLLFFLTIMWIWRISQKRKNMDGSAVYGVRDFVMCLLGDSPNQNFRYSSLCSIVFRNLGFRCYWVRPPILENAYS